MDDNRLHDLYSPTNSSASPPGNTTAAAPGWCSRARHTPVRLQQSSQPTWEHHPQLRQANVAERDPARKHEGGDVGVGAARLARQRNAGHAAALQVWGRHGAGQGDGQARWRGAGVTDRRIWGVYSRLHRHSRPHRATRGFLVHSRRQPTCANSSSFSRLNTSSAVQP